MDKETEKKLIDSLYAIGTNLHSIHITLVKIHNTLEKLASKE